MRESGQQVHPEYFSQTQNSLSHTCGKPESSRGREFQTCHKRRLAGKSHKPLFFVKFRGWNISYWNEKSGL
jgi:hypothetical protein